MLSLGEHLIEGGARSLAWESSFEVVTLAARQDGNRDLVDFGRREDELHVGRRFLQRLEKRVPGLRREHVHLVHDVDLEAVPCRAEGHPLLKSPHLVDAVVAGAVNLLNVEVLPGRDLRTLSALIARRRRGPSGLPYRARSQFEDGQAVARSSSFRRRERR